MPIYDLFSKRQKVLRGETPDVYRYDILPEQLRVQIIHIWFDALGNEQNWQYNQGDVRDLYQHINDVLCHEYGTFELPDSQRMGSGNPLTRLVTFFGQTKDVEKALDAIELTFRGIDGYTREFRYLLRSDASVIADAAIEELNDRFQEHGVGYRFSDGQLIRIDSELIHSEVVKPALHLLNQKKYAGAQQEFLKAHEHYRQGNSKEAITECGKSIESLMKSICKKRGWAVDPNAPAKTLIKACFDNGLIPQFWETQFSSLRTLLESSVPTGRNKTSAHGQGHAPTAVPSHIVAYILHMTASTIVFLAEAEAALP